LPQRIDRANEENTEISGDEMPHANFILEEYLLALGCVNKWLEG
jgi:hypothetical protein